MLIGRDYILKKSAGPSMPKAFLDTQIVPLATNLAGGAEVALDRAARRLRVRPATVLASLLGLASLSFVYARHLRKRTDLRSRSV